MEVNIDLLRICVCGEREANFVLRGIDAQASQLASQMRVPVVFDLVVCAAWYAARYQGPPVQIIQRSAV